MNTNSWRLLKWVRPGWCPVLLFLLTLTAPAQRTPSSQDLQQPQQDQQEIEAEVVWLQGALLRGNPAPYRNPDGPLAAYEQGLLDDEGQLWTVLDTPRGRELRYNPDLRGKKVKIKGWLHAKSRVIEIQEWRAGKHKVRTDEGFEMPDRPPFNPLKAETIESIPPIPLQGIDDAALKEDLWMTGEGYDLGIRESGQVRAATPSASTLEMQSLLDKLESELGSRSPEGHEPSGAHIPSTATATGSRRPPSAPKASPQGMAPPMPPPQAPASLLRNDQGQPLTTPDEFDQALQKELIQRISPQK